MAILYCMQSTDSCTEEMKGLLTDSLYSSVETGFSIASPFEAKHVTLSYRSRMLTALALLLLQSP
jgi:hypothetical protein